MSDDRERDTYIPAEKGVPTPPNTLPMGDYEPVDDVGPIPRERQFVMAPRFDAAVAERDAARAENDRLNEVIARLDRENDDRIDGWLDTEGELREQVRAARADVAELHDVLRRIANIEPSSGTARLEINDWARALDEAQRLARNALPEERS